MYKFLVIIIIILRISLVILSWPGALLFFSSLIASFMRESEMIEFSSVVIG